MTTKTATEAISPGVLVEVETERVALAVVVVNVVVLAAVVGVDYSTAI